jgi:hypothetical protein
MQRQCVADRHIAGASGGSAHAVVRRSRRMPRGQRLGRMTGVRRCRPATAHASHTVTSSVVVELQPRHPWWRARAVHATW